jgi:hypothetical protein
MLCFRPYAFALINSFGEAQAQWACRPNKQKQAGDLGIPSPFLLEAP